jgi:hypothetical protein
MSRSLAKLIFALSLGACALLIASLGTGAASPSMYLVNALSCVAVGINVYFLGKFLRALGWYRRKLATLLVGAGWLLLWSGLSVLMLANGLAECAGGCGYRSASLTDWLFMLGVAGLGLGFDRLLTYIHADEVAFSRGS